MDIQDFKQDDKRVKLFIQYFDKDKEICFINSWLKDRNMPPITREDLPEIGYIVYKQKVPIATIFLRQCEGNVVMIEGLCTNPSILGKYRHAAIDGLIEQAIDTAKEIKATKIIAYSQDKSTLERAKKHGFIHSEMIMIFREMPSSGQICN